MANVLKAVKVLLRKEGLFSDHPADPGGATKYGISLRFYRNNIKKDATRDDIVALTLEEATEIIKTYFWDEMGLYAVVSDDVATFLLSLGFNTGQSRAIKIAQKAINLALVDQYSNGAQKLKVDGVNGTNTTNAINLVYPDGLMFHLRTEAWKYYKKIMNKNPKLKAFKNGWYNRVWNE